MRLLFLLCVVLLCVRLYAAQHLGFGDSEALYASYAVHPQAAYLDHPGLVGLVARLLGSGSAPAPAAAHLFTAFVASAVPLLVAWAARVAGASPRAALVAGVIVAVTPEIAIGLFGLTPDLLLAPLWLASVGLALFGVNRPAAPAPPPEETRKKKAPGTKNKKSPPAPIEKEDWRRHGALAFAGLLAGVSASAKVSGLLLAVAIVWSFVVLRIRILWAWLGLLAGLLVFAPVVLFEATHGFPMVRHRLVEAPAAVTTSGFMLVLRNLGTLLGGQLAYLSPILAVIAVIVARDLVRERNRDPVARVLFATFAIPIVPLLFLCVWSPVAEPHWLAPPLLTLPIHAARRAGQIPLFGRRLLIAGGALAAVLTAAVHAWILVPSFAALLPTSFDPKLDITNELYGWPAAIKSVRTAMAETATPFDPMGRDLIVVGPHWIVCAQLQAGLPDVRVGCATPIKDDFDGWLPRDTWRAADKVLYVTDNRFPGNGAGLFPGHVVASEHTTRVYRAGRPARTFEFYLYVREAVGMR